MKNVLIWILKLIASLVIGFPLGWVLSMLLTPVLWALEPVLNTELAGHSGPADWVVLSFCIVSSMAVFAFFIRAARVCPKT